MSELSYSRVRSPPTPRRLDMLVPSGWESDSESTTAENDTKHVVPPNNIIDFLAEVDSNPAQQHTRFATSLSDEAVKEARKAAVPKTMQKDTLWCIRLWNEWTKERNNRIEEQIPLDITTLSPTVLQRSLSRFVLEVRKKDGTPYPLDSLYHLVCGIMRFIRQNGKPEIDFFKEATYAEFRATLDAELKRLKQAGNGSRKRKAEPLTQEEEKLLWVKSISLGIILHKHF